MNKLLENKRILVVDDNQDTCDLLRTVLEQAGATVVVAENVDAALAEFRQFPPHAVVADIRLRNTDGYELIKAIREHNRKYRGYTPAVAVTGFASPEDKERALVAGFNEYLPKPFNPADVVSAVESVLRGSADAAA